MKKKIALITGGSSGELEISLNSAKVISRNISKELFDVYVIVIRGSEWVYTNENGQELLVDKNDFSLTIENARTSFDCVFIAIHGTPGEDGKLQGYFDMLKIPYTASDVFTSALTFNKLFSNQVAENLGVKVGKLKHIRLDEAYDPDMIINEIGLPCFVKPNKGGSSVGITKVVSSGDLVPAIESGFVHDDEVLVQEYLDGFEITCGVMQTGDQLLILPLCEVVSKKEFFDYEAKYTDGMADEIVPARISEELTIKCKNLSAFLYEKLNCKGIVRFDYILVDGDYYFIEVNTIPGLSENSIVPKMVRGMGLGMQEVFTMLIGESIAWHQKRSKYS